MASPNLGLFNVPTISDFAREEEEFNMRKQQQAVQAQLAQAQLKKASELDIDALSDKALFNFYQGKPLTEADMAAVQARAVKEGNKTEYTKDALGNLIPSTAANPYSQFLSGLEGGQFKPAQTPRSAMPPQVFGNMLGGPALEDANIPQVAQDTFSFEGYGGTDPMQASQDATAQRKQYLTNGNPWNKGSALPDYQDNLQLDQTGQDMMAQEDAAGPVRPTIQVPDYVKNSPEVMKKTGETAVTLGADIAKMDYENQLKLVTEELKTNAGQSKVKTVLDRMNQINEQLKAKNAIVSKDQTLSQRGGAALASSSIGQAGRKVTDPESQALAEEYASLQSTLLPYYAAAAGLGAKSLDSEGERKSILNSFGNPAGIYEANQSQLQTLNKLFGGQGQAGSGAVSYEEYFK